ncbi:MAG: RNA polymerase subunit sigma-70 [Nannocystaceae bacterium]
MLEPQTVTTTPAPFDAKELAAHRSALRAHAYRMTASAADAEDAVQEAMIRAWRGRGRFRGDSSLRTWLLRIVTRTSLDILAKRRAKLGPRIRPTDDGAAGTVEDELRTREDAAWIEPLADADAVDPGLSPEEILACRRDLRLAFVAALQRLPARQRAALLLADVCGWRAPEVADTLETTPAAVNSALQRARATLRPKDEAPTRFAPDPLDPAHAQLLNAYVAAFEAYDIDALVDVLREDVTMCMPPYDLWLQGRADIGAWMRGRGIGCRGSRLLPIAANGTLGFAQYRRAPSGAYHPWSLILLELADGPRGPKIASVIHFLDTAAVFPRMGLPAELAPTS